MAFNRLMHPRNIYRKPPDFTQLANDFPEFAQHVIYSPSGKARIDFKSTEALRALTTTLLKKDFNLDVDLPLNRLVPTLPLRLNYILWIEDLLNGTEIANENETILGIDIGTGASCIYPLLGAIKNKWKFIATEIDNEAAVWARNNVQRNKLDDLIEVIKVEPLHVLQGIVEQKKTSFHFSMCNPPFFQDSCDSKPRYVAAEYEKVYEGGEEMLVGRMIQDSRILREKVRIYTSMLGKKSALQAVKNCLRTFSDIQFTTTEFCQGHVMRWGIAWTYIPQIQITKIKKPKPSKNFYVSHILPQVMVGVDYTVPALTEKVQSHLHELKIEYNVLRSEPNLVTMLIKAFENTWIHQRRKKRQLKRETMKAMQQEMQNTQKLEGQSNAAEVSSASSILQTSEKPDTEADRMGQVANESQIQCSEVGISDVSSAQKNEKQRVEEKDISDECKSGQCSKRKSDQECDEQSALKKIRTVPLLLCHLSVVKDEEIALTLHDPDPDIDKNVMQQLIMYFKNQFK